MGCSLPSQLQVSSTFFLRGGEVYFRLAHLSLVLFASKKLKCRFIGDIDTLARECGLRSGYSVLRGGGTLFLKELYALLKHHVIFVFSENKLTLILLLVPCQSLSSMSLCQCVKLIFVGLIIYGDEIFHRHHDENFVIQRPAHIGDHPTPSMSIDQGSQSFLMGDSRQYKRTIIVMSMNKIIVVS